MTEFNNVSVDIEVYTCDKCSPNGTHYNCLRPGNSLEGQIHVTSPSALHFIDIEISFQGLQSTQIISGCAPNINELETYYQLNYGHSVLIKSNDLFVDVNYKVNLELFRDVEWVHGSIVYSFPFFFVIPHGNEGTDVAEPLLCQILPPTFMITALHSDPVSVTYKLHAAVKFRKVQDANTEEPETPQKIEKSQTVNFLPYSDAEPPTYVASFPDEFVSKTTSPIWKYALGRRLGELTMSTSEPLPLVYSPHEARPSSALTLSITADAPLTAQRLRAISLSIKPAIRVKTFYSSEPMPCVPKQTLLDQNHSIRLHSAIIKLDHMDFTRLDWIYGPRIHTDEPPRYEDALLHSAVQSTSTDSSPELSSGNEWRASVRIPISPSDTLPPTFCASLVSRSYSLVLRVRVAGLHTSKSVFEIPLQVVYLKSQQIRNDSVVDESEDFCVGPEGLLAQHYELPAYHPRSW